jgi:hypothetical protein
MIMETVGTVIPSQVKAEAAPSARRSSKPALNSLEDYISQALMPEKDP